MTARTRALAFAAAAALAALLTAAPTARAQGIPGVGSEGGAARAEYLRFAMTGILRTLAEWDGAWRSGDPAALGSLYADEATLLPADAGESLRGRAEIGAFWAAQRSQDAIALRLDDFDVSANLAFVQGDFEVAVPGEGGAVAVRGTHLTVLVLEGRRWWIRSQVFRPA